MAAFDAVLLSRIQFGFTVGYHILFPTLTIGLSLFLVAFEGAWLRTGKQVYMALYRLWVKVFAISFGMGVVTGIVLAFQFGTNFSRFTELSGAVLGPLISAEALTAFFLEAGFIGIMLFGRDKVGPRLHVLATVLVAVGTVISAFWILSANSWMQTPAGAALHGGRYVVVDWWAVIFTSSFPYRLVHMLLASFLTASFVVAGVSAWYLRKGHVGVGARTALRMALLAAAILAPLQIVAGDLHGLQVKRDQPVKLAAIEAIWDTGRGLPFLLFAWPDQAAERNRWEFGIPKLGSLILTHEMDGEIAGLKAVPPEDRPPVAPVFWSFRVMVAIGFAMLLVAFWGLYARWRGRLYTDVWLHRACIASIPFGFVAVLCGWIVAEVGRQPWSVQGLNRTADSVSPVVASAVATSLAVFVVVYSLLSIAYVYFVTRVVRHAPEAEAPPRHAPEAMRGARPGLVVAEAED